ncbi:winged helix-turn-helix domain-containing protein [Streptomyces sp. UNOB3_S3]|uniref:winged helix-turn-helix domain-containing protein n=1 Tax=Streptomyces sp. UNOB3_S3 TaxID=2871682 RepID=UPI001E50642C|nr:winged helix-turn-helix domain-containing protein [Streptomyces sp. UNOB3_S3]
MSVSAWKCPARGSPGRPKLSEALFTVLEQELNNGPVAHGRPDQTWILEQIKPPIGRRLHKSITLSAIAQALRRHSWRRQVPARRALERDRPASDLPVHDPRGPQSQ